MPSDEEVQKLADRVNGIISEWQKSGALTPDKTVTESLQALGDRVNLNDIHHQGDHWIATDRYFFNTGINHG